MKELIGKTIKNIDYYDDIIYSIVFEDNTCLCLSAINSGGCDGYEVVGEINNIED